MAKIEERLTENFYTVLEFVNHVGVISHSGVYKKIQKGIIPSVIIDNKTYIPKLWVKQHYDDVIDAALAKVAE